MIAFPLAPLRRAKDCA